mmetsp:Transcript_58962/g.133495  ORF Transcript_58962/g.133495 Transcript_58962/m.133495 type:complete len:272 (+) Transcript_58962:777-1592(+)
MGLVDCTLDTRELGSSCLALEAAFLRSDDLTVEGGDIMLRRVCVLGENAKASVEASLGDNRELDSFAEALDRELSNLVRLCCVPGVMRCALMMGVSSPRPGDHGRSSSICPPGELKPAPCICKSVADLRDFRRPAAFAPLGRPFTDCLEWVLIRRFLVSSPFPPSFLLSVPTSLKVAVTTATSSFVGGGTSVWISDLEASTFSLFSRASPAKSLCSFAVAPSSGISRERSSLDLDFLGLFSFGFLIFGSRCPLGARARTALRTPSRSPRKS